MQSSFVQKYPCHPWGIGAKISYWQAKGSTPFLNQCTLIQEVPVTVYIRAIKDWCHCQFYASLGGGFIWLQEKNYLGNGHIYKGIGEAEIGFNYFMYDCFNLTAAFRYLFPRQTVKCIKGIDVGGFDLRAGIGFSF